MIASDLLEPPPDSKFAASSSKPELRRGTPDSAESVQGLGGLLEKTGPWLFSVGNWICGGLTAFGLVAISALLTVGPLDKAVLLSTKAFACSLPWNVSAIFVLRILKDITRLSVDELALQSFRDARLSKSTRTFRLPTKDDFTTQECRKPRSSIASERQLSAQA